jgi:methylase of polypeptide subunit release factors
MRPGNFLRWLLQPFRRTLLRRRVGRLVLEEIDGLPLLVLPDVLNPVVFRTGVLLARAAAARLAAHGGPAGSRLLDLGCGTGVVGLLAARAGAKVVSVDLNPSAVRNAGLNALLNGLEGAIDVRKGDLFEAVAGERFDLVVFNPPFFRGKPRDAYDMAWRSEDVYARFCAGAAGVLSPSGEALVLLSSHGDEPAMRALLAGAGLEVSMVERRPLGDETLSVVSAVPRTAR